MVTHSNLSTGYQIAQTAHVIAEFILHHPESSRTWHDISHSLVVLETKNSQALLDLYEKALSIGFGVQPFREADLANELTALAFEPSERNRKFLSNLPLAGKGAKNQEVLRAREKAVRNLSYEMMNCEQTKGQDVLQHGSSVREHYFALVNHLTGRTSLSDAPNWKIPTWLEDNKEAVLATLPPAYVMDRYLVLHDCGKPAVREVDANGRVHFPNHAESSAKVYRETFGSDASDEVEYLIAHDMDVHMLKAAGMEEFAKNPTAVGQMLAALSEVTANAAMFGGIESTSFKIKYKQIDQRSKALMKLLFSS